MSRWLVTIGLALVIVGLLWPWLSKLGLGRLPGDSDRARERSHLFPDCDVHYRQCGAVLHPVVDEPLTPRGISALDPNERLMNFDTAGCLSCKAPISKTDSYQCQIATVGYFTRSEPHRKAENSDPLMSTSARRRWL